MLRALDARWPRVKQGAELHRIEVPPAARVGVVVDWTRLAAFGTTERSSLNVLDEHINLLSLGIQLDIRYEPRRSESQDLLVEIGFVHGCSPSWRILPDPHKSRMDPIKGAWANLVSCPRLRFADRIRVAFIR